MSDKVYGWIVIHKESGKLAGTRSQVFETKNAAAAGFYQWTKRMWGGQELHLKDKKLSEQDEYVVKPLVLLDE